VRIIAGSARGRPLRAPAGKGTRPTSDRTREALFSAVEALLGGLGGRRVLDLYAGSGAVGLEALSRGAAEVLLVERDAGAVGVIRRNIEAVGLPGATVVGTAAERLVAEAAPTAYDLVFADAPYADDPGPTLSALVAHGWLAPGGVLVVERSTRDAPWRWPDGVTALRDKRYGEATLWYGRRAVDEEDL
jgi:16S rRNA (guanine966-N2)-methyltransferase